MKFTGTLIEDLMATVERAERKAQSDGTLLDEPLLVGASLVDPMFVETSLVEPWFASVQENTDNDSQFIGVA